MSYRSLKRVLGETNLERKCRILFGTCLLLLIAGSFYLVWKRTEELVEEKNSTTGSLLVEAIMYKIHFRGFETDPERKPLVAEISKDLKNQSYRWQFLSLKESQWTQLPSSPEEVELLRSLKKAMAEQNAKLASKSETNQDANSRIPNGPAADGPNNSDKPNPVFEDRWYRGKGEYHYYQPASWTGWERSCHVCHSEKAASTAALGAAQASALSEDERPFHVIKVMIPDVKTQQAINKNRAILIATAIITVFLAMIALYVIVKYVIIKPLTHLRDVSDEISRGNTTLRAEIHTNDEFEELGSSFNRMLRHLTEAQAKLSKANTKLDSKVDELAQANMQLYEMNRLKSNFLANMSHELRTPLNSIIGFSEVLHGIDALDEKQRRYAGNIRKSGRVLLDMINDILDLAKMESGKMDVRPTEFQIGSIIEAQCDLVRSLADEKNIGLEIDLAAGLPPMLQDQGKVQQILTNLLSNAIKFTPEGGRITVSARCTGDGQLELTVTDTGVGIAEEDREVIFEKFRQATAVLGSDGMTREFSGTGLGLSIIKELCILLGGEVTFQSELGKGSAFTVHLPWTRTDQPRLDSALTTKLDELTKPSSYQSSVISFQ